MNQTETPPGTGNPGGSGSGPEDLRSPGYVVIAPGIIEALIALVTYRESSMALTAISIGGLIFIGLAVLVWKVVRTGFSILLITIAAILMTVLNTACHFGGSLVDRSYGLSFIYAVTGDVLIAGATTGLVFLAEGIAGVRRRKNIYRPEAGTTGSLLSPGQRAVLPPPRSSKAAAGPPDQTIQPASAGTPPAEPSGPERTAEPTQTTRGHEH